MNDALDIKRIFRADQYEHYDALEVIWPAIADHVDAVEQGKTPPLVPLDLKLAQQIMDMTVARHLEPAMAGVEFEGDALVARVYRPEGVNLAEESVTFYAPVHMEGEKIVESAPVAMNKAKTLDYAMLVNFGCCSKAALSLVVMIHINDRFHVIQLDADNVGPLKRQFFAKMFTPAMQTAHGAHIAMHAIGQKHDCASHAHDHFKPTKPRIGG